MNSYRISIEAYNKEFVTLSDKYKLLLFKLQVSYCFKGSPLNNFDIAGIFNVELPLDETTKLFLSKYFLETAEGEWVCPTVDSQKQEEEQRLEKEVQKRVARALAGMKGGLKRVQNLKARGLPVQAEDDSDAIFGHAEGQQYPDEEVAIKQMASKPQANGKQNPSIDQANFKQSTGKIQANEYQNSTKPQANAKQISSKEQANLKQTASKLLAKEKQTSSKCQANGWQTSSKDVANPKRNPSKSVANADLATAGESQPIDFQEKSEALSNVPEFEPEDDRPLAYVRASDNPINPISDNFLINKKNKDKSESVSESVKEKTENLKNQNSREIETFSAGKVWTQPDAKKLLVDSGLDEKFLDGWISRSEGNQRRFASLLCDVLPRFDRDAFDQLIARCKEQKRSEGTMFAGSIAYVISSLEREKVTVKARRKKRSSERNYTEGLIQNPDGSWRPDPHYVPKKKRYSDRDWTEGLIKNPDGSYSLDPNYEG